MADSIYDSHQLHDPHREIRLVEIAPCTNTSEPILCRLRKVCLSDNPGYTALSYVCGNPAHTKTIWVDGVRMGVTENLDLVLRRIRHPTRAQDFWIDAISINQLDLAERSTQVRNMERIFGQAIQVLCWLGPAEEGFDTALAALDTSRLTGSGNLTIEEGRSIDEAFMKDSLTDRTCAALDHLASSPYWKRTWIVQEFALARELVIFYGSVELPLQFFQDIALLAVTMSFGAVAARATSAKHDTLLKFFLAVSEILKVRRRMQTPSEEQEGILNVVTQNLATNATDLRDKIFGLYSLANDSARFVTVDYFLPVADTYRNFAWRHVWETQRLDIILRAGINEQRDHGNLVLPSWVPDWSLTEWTGMSLKQGAYFAAKDTKYEGNLYSFNNVLCARGIFCDKVAMFKIGNTSFGHEDLLFSRGPYDYPTATPRLQALFRAVTVDRYYLSDHRLNDDPDHWLVRLMVAFLIDLGLQTDRDALKQVLDQGLPDYTPEEFDGELPELLSNVYITAFRGWAEASIRVLDDMISNRHFPVPKEDGALSTLTLHARLESLELLGYDHQATNAACPHVEHLEAWRRSLEDTRDASTMQEMLQLFLGRLNESNTITLTNLPAPGTEMFYWPRLHMTRGRILGLAYIFATESGYLGTGPQTMRKGDVLAVLHGCTTPVLLRPVDDRYIFVGACFVEGLMNGQAIDLCKEGKLTEQIFEII